MAKLDSKVAVVTGGSSGIGRATAISLAAEGAAVAIGGRKADALEAKADAIGAAVADGGPIQGALADLKAELVAHVQSDDLTREAIEALTEGLFALEAKLDDMTQRTLAPGQKKK